MQLNKVPARDIAHSGRHFHGPGASVHPAVQDDQQGVALFQPALLDWHHRHCDVCGAVCGRYAHSGVLLKIIDLVCKSQNNVHPIGQANKYVQHILLGKACSCVISLCCNCACIHATIGLAIMPEAARCRYFTLGAKNTSMQSAVPST